MLDLIYYSETRVLVWQSIRGASDLTISRDTIHTPPPPWLALLKKTGKIFSAAPVLMEATDTPGATTYACRACIWLQVGCHGTESVLACRKRLSLLMPS